MDFLLDPNIAYLFLLGGALLAMLALVTPGTGLLELGAVFCMALAGYAIYNLSFNVWALVILAAAIAPFVYAIQKPKRELFLGLSIVLLVVGSIFIFPRSDAAPVVNPFVAVVASSLVAGFLWIAVRKSLEAVTSRPSHDLDALIGQLGEARTDVYQEGSVQVGGELWSARSDYAIPLGSEVRIVQRDGFVLVVERNRSEKKAS